jgi:tetratricopeptide (TPR) repeat protein
MKPLYFCLTQQKRHFRLAILSLLTSAWNCAHCIRDPINPQAREHVAFCARYYAEGRLSEAEARCRLAREYAPKYAEPLNLLGLIEYSRGHRDQARQFFKDAIALKEHFAEAHNNLGVLFMDERQFFKARDTFKQAIQIDPGYVNARVNLGLCLFYSGHRSKARKEYMKCLELQPQACDCRQGLGLIAASEKDFEEAKAQFTRMTEICPHSPIGFYNLCQVFYDMGQCGNSVEACMKALAIKPDYLEARKNLKLATECLALEDVTIKEYTESIKKKPRDPDLHFNLGVIYAEKRLLEAALNEFLNTIALDSHFLLAYYRAARIYDELVNTANTIRMCQKFVDALRDNKFSEEKDWCILRVKELQYR